MQKNLLNKSQLIEVSTFIENTNFTRLSNSLRIVLLEYVAQNKDCLPLDFDLQLNDWNMLFDFLAVIKKD